MTKSTGEGTDPLVVLVTGCSEGGIGESLALEFAKQGCQVVATARSLKSMPNLCDHSRVLCLPLDVTVEASVAQAVQTAIDKLGRIDIVVNNAGIPCFGPIAELPLALLEKGFNTNVLGTVSVTQKLIPHMIARRKGMIVNIGSISTFAPGAWTGGYIATKCAINALTDVLRLELKPFNIKVVLVEPGAISTKFGLTAVKFIEESLDLHFFKAFKESIVERALLTKSSKATSPEEFASVTVQALLRSDPPRRFVYGQLSTFATICSYLPLWIRDYLFGKLYGIDRVVAKNPNLFVRH